MANTQSMCTSFKQDVLNAVHAFSTNTPARTASTADTFKAALYLASATMGASTTAYTATGEVTGTNYTAGGVALSWIAPATSGTTAFSTPSASIVYTNVTLPTSFDCVLIYNNTAAGKNAVSVNTFTAQTITAGTLTLTMPTNDGTTGLIRFT